MFQQLQAPGDAYLALRMAGGISDKETGDIVRKIRAVAARHGKVRLFLLMEQYTSFNSAEDFYYDLRFARQCSELIDRMAIVGDRSWKATWVGLFGLFGRLDTAYFDQTQAREALQWLNHPPPVHSTNRAS